MSTQYFILANVLYRRRFSSEYSRCLDENEAKEVVREAHEGICGGHIGYQTLVKQIIRAGYYMEDHAARLLSFCEEVCRMSNTCTFYSCSRNISAICCLSMAVLHVGLRCRRSHHSLCFKWPQILPCRNGIFHQVDRSYHPTHSRRTTHGLFHSQEHPFPFRHPT